MPARFAGFSPHLPPTGLPRRLQHEKRSIQPYEHPRRGAVRRAGGDANANGRRRAAGTRRPRRQLCRPSPFGPLKHVQAGLLDVAYAETGPAQGPVVILLHGWPYDIHSYDEVAPLLAAKGYRVLMPYARGYGDTHFLSDQTLRNGQPAALASDVIDFMDALNIQQAVLGGYDWGARSADIVSALWPERVKALVSVSGYLIGNQAAGQNPLPPKAELQWWYQFYFATERGRDGYRKNTHDFAS
jgi:hypothetical protein